MSVSSRDNALFLRPRTKIQPLSARWPTWSHLIAPAQQAMNVAYRHLPNLRSFVKTPRVHVAAAQDPSMVGGPFVCLSEAQVPAVQALISETTAKLAALLRFAEDYRNLNTRVQSASKGQSLDEHYADLPASLRGLVEMTYDLNNHPEVRVREEMLYAGGLDNDSGEELCIRSVADAERDFFMSTPVLDGPGKLFVKARFDDPIVDLLASLRLTPRPLAELEEALREYGCNVGSLGSFLTDQQPERRAPAYNGHQVRIRYFGHACVLLQTKNTSILIDPITAWERDDDQAALTFDDLPDRIDFVVITHSHHDHLVPEMLIQLRRRIGTVIVPRNNAGSLADPSLKLILRRLGFVNVTVADPLDRIEVPGGEIVMLPFAGEHCDLAINSKHCVVIKLLGKSFAFLVDSDGTDSMMYRLVLKQLGTIHTLFIGMECQGAPLTWLYGPLLGKSISRREDESRRLNGADCHRAWQMIQEFGTRSVFVYAMGQEHWLKSIMGLEYQPDSIQIVESNKLIDQCREAGIAAQRLKGCQEMFV